MVLSDGFGKVERFLGHWIDSIPALTVQAVVVADDFTVRAVPLESLTVQAKTFQIQSDRAIYNTLEK